MPLIVFVNSSKRDGSRRTLTLPLFWSRRLILWRLLSNVGSKAIVDQVSFAVLARWRMASSVVSSSVAIVVECREEINRKLVFEGVERMNDMSADM